MTYGDDRPPALSYSGSVRKERGRMAIGAHAEQDEVEPRGSAARSAEGTDHASIPLGGLGRWAEFAQHPVDPAGFDRNAREERLPCRPIVALGLIGTDASFVTEEYLDVRPGERRSIVSRHVTIERLRRLTAGEHPPEVPLGPYCVACPRGDVTGEGRARRGKVGVDTYRVAYEGVQ